VAIALDQTPEISVYRLEPEITDNILRLKGKVPNNTLKEKAGTIARQVVPQKILDNQIISVVVPVDSSFTATEVKRMTLIINQIPGNLITTKFKEGEVTITGITKDQESINKITAILKAVPGIKLILNQVQLGNINQNSISRRIYFEAGSATFPADSLPQIIEVKNLLNFSPNFRLRITGHTDATGEPTENQRLATARAASVQQILLNQGIDQSRLEIRGSNNALPEAAELWQSRFVEFELIAPNIQN
jgi:outer membrane protein OmpA-like peptidoglycan-associated protein